MIFRQIVFSALLVGVLSGIVLTAVQSLQVVPIILGAEVFEGETVATPALQHSGQHQHAAHEHSTDEWAPDDGVERTAYTLMANVLTAMGFAILVIVVMVTSFNLKRNGLSAFDWRHGLIWSAAGYTVFWLAPALGLPPEIPLAAAAPLEARQLWWLFTVICTATGLAGLAFGKTPWRWIFPLLLVVPHLVGAPHLDIAMFGEQPPTAAAKLEILAQQFIGATAIANAALWLVLGVSSAWAVRRIILFTKEESSANIESPSI